MKIKAKCVAHFLSTTFIKASAHSFKQFTSRILKLSFSLSMHIYNSDRGHAWFHLYGTRWPVRCASEAKKYKMKNSCPQWDSNPQPWYLKSDALPTELAGLVVCCLFKWPYYIMYSRYLCIHVHYYKYENDKGQRILSGKSTVLCYILEYIGMLYK